MIDVLLIGEAYGKTENMFLHAFVGTSGQELCRMGGEAKLFPPFLISCRKCDARVVFGRCSSCGTFNAVGSLEMVRFWAKTLNHGVGIANVFDKHPSQDNIELFFTKRQDPEADLSFPLYKRGSKAFFVQKHYAHHVHALYEKILNLKPKILILLGNTACWAVLGQTKISEIRGTRTQSVFPPGFPVLATYHPAALRDWSLRPTIIADLIKARKFVQGGSKPNITPRWILVNPTLEEISNWLDIPSPRRGVDIESAYIFFSKAELSAMSKTSAGRSLKHILASHISMVGFSRNEHHAMVIPFMKRREDGFIDNYWPDKESEFKAWMLCQKALSSGAELVTQNGAYDYNRLFCCAMRPINMIHDTMFLQHALFPEALKGLGYLGSIHTDEQAWKSMYGSESLKRDE